MFLPDVTNSRLPMTFAPVVSPMSCLIEPRYSTLSDITASGRAGAGGSADAGAATARSMSEVAKAARSAGIGRAPTPASAEPCALSSFGRMAATAHSDDARTARFDVGPMGADWHLLGAAAGCDKLGLRRIRISAGRQSTPVHGHFGEEEIFYVERGSGYSWQEDGVYPIGEGDFILHPHGGPAHTIVAGEDGIDVLAFGDDLRHEAVRFPRMNAMWIGGMVLDFHPVHQFELEAERAGAAGIPDQLDPRPKTILNVADVEPMTFQRDRIDARSRFIGRALGARRTALNLTEIAPGAEAAQPHCHSGIEELFVVLDGDGVLLLGDDESE